MSNNRRKTGRPSAPKSRPRRKCSEILTSPWATYPKSKFPPLAALAAPTCPPKSRNRRNDGGSPCEGGSTKSTKRMKSTPLCRPNPPQIPPHLPRRMVGTPRRGVRLAKAGQPRRPKPPCRQPRHPLPHPNPPIQSIPIKPNQGKSRYFSTHANPINSA